MVTNQDVVNIFYGAADVLDIPGGWTLVQKAGWEWLADNRSTPFDASHLSHKPPNLSEVEWAHLHSRISGAIDVAGGVPDSGHGTDDEPSLIPPDEGGEVDITVVADEDDERREPEIEKRTPFIGKPDVTVPERHGSLLGPAFAVPYNSADAEKAYAAQPVVTKVVGEWLEVLRLGEHIPHAIHVYRHWDQWETVFPYPSTDLMPRLVQKWMNNVEPERRMAEFLEAGGKTLHFEAFNEPGIHDPELMKYYTEFEALRIEALAEVGCLACTGQFSVGSPTNENMTAFLPAIETLNKTVVDGQIGSLGIHEYGTVWPWAWMGRNQDSHINDDPFPDVTDPTRTKPAYLIGRFQHYYEDVFEPAGYGNTPLILTETGLDTIVDPRILEYLAPRDEYPHGYRTCFSIWNRLLDFESNMRQFAPGVLNKTGTQINDPEGFYFELLKWQDEFLRQFPFVRGALPFMCGGYEEWESFYIQHEAMTKFMNYVKAANEAAPT